jgi:hypothetical protein
MRCNMERMSRTLMRVALLLGCSLAVGCGGKATVKGVVTYEGKPVTGGVVVIFDAEGNNPAERGIIQPDGTYTVRNIMPGKRKATAAATRPFYPPSEAADRMPRPTLEYPDDAAGNGELVTLTSGTQTLNLTLRQPNNEPKPAP